MPTVTRRNWGQFLRSLHNTAITTLPEVADNTKICYTTCK